MTPIKMSFVVRLTSFLEQRIYPSGPIFSRFLPDGEADAVHLTPESDPHEIRVWFERRAKLENSMLRWDQQGKEFDPAIMRRQAKLDAGYLFGKMNMPASNAELAALKNNPKETPQEFGLDIAEDPDYIGFAKRLIDTLQPRLAVFVSTLRCQYGQYWLQVPRSWDSRSETLGSYCTGQLMLRWWHEEKQTRCWLLPTSCGMKMTVAPLPGRKYEEYLTESDWRRLQTKRCLVDVSTELQLLASAGQSLDSGNCRQAFVEVISALELAVSNRLASRNERIRSAVDSFLDRETRSSHVAVVMLMIGASEREIEISLKAIKIRNDVVHEGYDPTESDGRILREVIQAIRKINNLDELKTPGLDLGSNMLYAPEPI